MIISLYNKWQEHVVKWTNEKGIKKVAVEPATNARLCVENDADARLCVEPADARLCVENVELVVVDYLGGGRGPKKSGYGIYSASNVSVRPAKPGEYEDDDGEDEDERPQNQSNQQLFELSNQQLFDLEKELLDKKKMHVLSDEEQNQLRLIEKQLGPSLT